MTKTGNMFQRFLTHRVICVETEKVLSDNKMD